ncbi:MAG: hypothetical protein EOP46_01305 [Sphingobacteriaceae bacterium]|nr:MAG: hypothetical protein EOP46_01305 [Sphingobacteriaceae bacterium]
MKISAFRYSTSFLFLLITMGGFILSSCNKTHEPADGFIAKETQENSTVIKNIKALGFKSDVIKDSGENYVLVLKAML